MTPFIPLSDLRVSPKPIEPCGGCRGWGWSRHGAGQGFVPPSGSGTNGVLILAEAAGGDEEDSSTGLVGRAGYYLFTELAKAGIDREGFRLANVLACRPPENALAGMSWQAEVIAACSPLLDAEVASHAAAARARGQQPVILTLGKIAFRRAVGPAADALFSEDYHGYVHQSVWPEVVVLSADHPSFLMRGQHQLVPVLQYSAQRAIEVAASGEFVWDDPPLILDPPPPEFARLVAEVPIGAYLSVDIETPMKAKTGEDALVREDDEDYIILRCSFSWQRGDGSFCTISIPWEAGYFPAIEALLARRDLRIVGWNLGYDLPRIRVQFAVRGASCDAMLWWHVLNSALDKRLGFVTPFYWQNARMWKQESSRRPAYYNAVDALAALINILGIERDLREQGLWGVVERHIIRLHQVTDRMSEIGVLRDEVLRREAEERLTVLIEAVEAEMIAAIPADARRLKIFAKEPKDVDGLVRVQTRAVVKRCGGCGVESPKKAHFAPPGKKALKAGVTNPCQGQVVVESEEDVSRWARQLEWKPSQVQLLKYQASLRHSAIQNRQRGTATFDEDAVKVLMRRYPRDPLYPRLLRHRKYQKLRGTYFGITQPDGRIKGGLRIGRDGRIHPEFTSNPNTLRMACQNPNMQNLQRPSSADSEDARLGNMVRNQVIAGVGQILLERDYSAIEAVLTAWAAGWRDGIRLAKLGIHSYLASHVLERPADLGWSDDDLRAYFKEIKKSNDPRVQLVYNGCKRAIHLSNYGGTPRKMVQAEPETFPDEAYARRLQDLYFEVASPIRKWHLQTQLLAHSQGYLKNPFGYLLRFTHVFRNVKEGGKWVRKPGDQANEALAFIPQSTAAGIIKEAMIRLSELVLPGGLMVLDFMRLQVHDSLVLEVPVGLLDTVDDLLRREMEAPVPQLPLPESFGMGAALVVETERKVGVRWGECH